MHVAVRLPLLIMSMVCMVLNHKLHDQSKAATTTSVRLATYLFQNTQSKPCHHSRKKQNCSPSSKCQPLHSQRITQLLHSRRTVRLYHHHQSHQS